ncbi:MAG: TonB-dependent receptor [Paludibacteraceae bacterium]|nr:TonB-dependent receptor [Paludibacteraceae bacterium]
MMKKHNENGFRSLLMTFAVFAMSLVSISAMAEPISIVGKVVDANGEPLVGASVVEAGTSNGTITDLDGAFILSVEKNVTLHVSYVGYKDSEVRAQKDMVVVLRENTQVLDEVVAIGYGTQKKANLTGAVTTVDVSKTLESKTESDVTKALQGAVPGLTITNATGDLNADPTVVIRGIGTLSNSGTSTPLYIVDGVPMENLGYLNANDIESISVLKDASATSIYGTRAAFGVVLVTTKTAKTQDKVSVTYNNNFAWSRATALPDYPDVLTQAQALTDANTRAGLASELFGMYLNSDEFIAGATRWAEWASTQGWKNNKSPYRKMEYGLDWDKNGFYADWDVAGIMFNDATPSQQHNLSVSGNSGKTNYYISLGYNHQQGLMNFNPDKMDKFNAAVNISTKVNKWLEIGARFNMQHRIYTYPYVRGQGTYQYVWRWGSFFGPYGYFEDAEGNQYEGRNMIGFRKAAAGPDGDGSNDTYRKRMNMRAGGFIKLNLAKGLTFNGDYTFTYRAGRYKGVGYSEDLVNTWSLFGEDFAHGKINTSTFIETENTHYYNHVANMFLNYNGSWSGHNLNVMLGANLDKSEYEYLYYERHAMQDENLPELALCSEDYSYSHSHSHSGSAGVFGRINYDYKGIYLIELSGRYDGSSKFPTHTQWAFFPSGSVGYRISEEAYFQEAKEYVSNLKVRASYGVIGNQEIGSNMFLETMSKTTNGVSWLGTGSSKYDYFGQPKMVDPTLTWETIATTNIGIDLGFLNNDLNVNFDWYQRMTTGMLAPGKTLPQVVGATAAYENAGSLRTRGWELNIDYRHTFVEADNLTVHANFNLADYKATITEWDSNDLINTKYTGKEYGEIWGFETDRYFTWDDFNADGTYKEGIASQKGIEKDKGFTYGPGDIKFVDQNGDGVIDWGDGTKDNHGDLVKIGNTTPRYQYSFRLGADWKGFDIDLFFQGVGKRNAWSPSAFVMPLTRGADAIYAWQTDYITEADYAAHKINQDAAYPRMWPGNAGQGVAGSSILDAGKNNFYPQDKYLMNLSYLRLKNLTVGYTLPQHLTRKATIEKVRIYASFNNLADLINHTAQYGFDPEVSTGSGTGSFGNGTYGRTEPLMRSYSFGLQVTL